jgi:sugar transferase (PEP-CTERM/EpsH1 system associated)
MGRILFLCHRIPYPPDKGDKIRSWHFLKHLAENHEVYLGCFIDDAYDDQYRDTLKEICADAFFVSLHRRPAKLRALRSFLRGESVTLGYYDVSEMARWVRTTITEKPPQLIFVYSSSMAQYVTNCPNMGRRVIDFVDVDSDKWHQYASKRYWPLSWLYEWEARKLLQCESAVASNFDAAIFVNAKEADLFKKLVPQAHANVFVVDNGVDVDFFSPDVELPYPLPERRPYLVFTGAMDYFPNIDGVCWFATHVFPELRRRHPDLQFVIVGANPARQVQALAQKEGIVVTGRTADVRPFLRHAAGAIAPIRISRGTQNKVLEAMAMGQIVVATPQALDGLDVEIGQEVLVAANEAEFIRSLDDILSNLQEQSLGKRARRRMLSEYTWRKKLTQLDSVLALQRKEALVR